MGVRWQKSGFYFPGRDAVCLRCPFITAGFKILSKTAWHLEIHRPGVPLWSLLTPALFTLSLALLTQYPYHIRRLTQPLPWPFAGGVWVDILHFFALQKGEKKKRDTHTQREKTPTPELRLFTPLSSPAP